MEQFDDKVEFGGVLVVLPLGLSEQDIETIKTLVDHAVNMTQSDEKIKMLKEISEKRGIIIKNIGAKKTSKVDIFKGVKYIFQSKAQENNNDNNNDIAYSSLDKKLMEYSKSIKLELSHYHIDKSQWNDKIIKLMKAKFIMPEIGGRSGCFYVICSFFSPPRLTIDDLYRWFLVCQHDDCIIDTYNEYFKKRGWDSSFENDKTILRGAYINQSLNEGAQLVYERMICLKKFIRHRTKTTLMNIPGPIKKNNLQDNPRIKDVEIESILLTKPESDQNNERTNCELYCWFVRHKDYPYVINQYNNYADGTFDRHLKRLSKFECLDGTIFQKKISKFVDITVKNIKASVLQIIKNIDNANEKTLANQPINLKASNPKH